MPNLTRLTKTRNKQNYNKDRNIVHLYGIGLAGTVLGLLDRLQNHAIRLINNRSITDDIPPLQIRRNIVSLVVMYRYFYGRCLGELHDMVPSLLPRPRITRGLNDTQRFSLFLILCRTHVYKQSFFTRTISLWMWLPNQCFPENYNIDLFKKRCYNYFIINRVIFEVIGISLKSEHLTSPHLTPPIVLF